MAHFAKLTEDGTQVLAVNVVDNSKILKNGIEDEATGQLFLEKVANWPAYLWVKTSYNTLNNRHKNNGTPFRGNFASVGYTWDSENQIFWPPKPYPSWVKNIEDARWQSPIGDHPGFVLNVNPLPIPSEEEKELLSDLGDYNKGYVWNETNQVWDLKTE
jgi:hypothetical protein